MRRIIGMVWTAAVAAAALAACTGQVQLDEAADGGAADASSSSSGGGTSPPSSDGSASSDSSDDATNSPVSDGSAGSDSSDGGCTSPTSFDASGGSWDGGFPVGAYDDCIYTTFLDTPGGGGSNGAGGAAVVSQSGSTLTVSYGGDGGVVDTSLEFTATSGSSATILPGQEVDGIDIVCGNLEQAPSVTQVASGSLTYNAGTMFLSVVGTAEPLAADAGCSSPGGQVALVVTCNNDWGAPGGSDAGSSATASGSDFVGVYSCSSVVESFGASPGGSVSGGPGGTLTITETCGVLTAASTAVKGSLEFVPTTNGAAAPATPNQSVQVQWPSPYTLPVTSSTLTIDGNSVVLSAVGGNGASETVVSLLCTK